MELIKQFLISFFNFTIILNVSLINDYLKPKKRKFHAKHFLLYKFQSRSQVKGELYLYSIMTCNMAIKNVRIRQFFAEFLGKISAGTIFREKIGCMRYSAYHQIVTHFLGNFRTLSTKNTTKLEIFGVKKCAKKFICYLDVNLGSFILALVGIGAAHATKFNEGASSIHGAVAGGIGVTLGIYAACNVSGGHINPAVTAGFLVLGKMGNGFLDNIVGALVYWTAQILGMFSAAAVVFGIYFSALEDTLDSGDEQYVCLYATCPGNAYTNNQVKL